ncbi:MAG: DUF6055 domain-containing protein [Planctomycetia bacterium]|nr:DUF6055 domain-containing protein [Planctomycetia bacterium]
MIVLLIISLILVGATANAQDAEEQSDDLDHPYYYCPQEFRELDFNSNLDKWSWRRSRESEHFICFWEQGFGDDPNDPSVEEALRVDVDDLLRKAETFWHTNVQRVKMVELGNGKSQLERYKLQIYLLYTHKWVATGAGYDDVIGALWVSPSTCKPVGSVIAHEIGHSFQYQVYCDQRLSRNATPGKSGFRYGYKNSHGGNGFWEQCAQWVAFEDYPMQTTLDWQAADWPKNSNLAFEHELTRYQSYWLQRFWTKKHGVDVIGRIWRESVYPEGALQTYARIFCDNDPNLLNDELYQYAVSMATRDLLPEGAPNFPEEFQATCYNLDDNWRQIAYASCPGAGGFNVIPIENAAGKRIILQFQGLDADAKLAPDDPGEFRFFNPQKDAIEMRGKLETYNQRPEAPGWRYGLVATLPDGKTIQSKTLADVAGQIVFDVPQNAKAVYFVVLGAPSKVLANPWDDDESTDYQAPYKYRVTIQ